MRKTFSVGLGLALLSGSVVAVAADGVSGFLADVKPSAEVFVSSGALAKGELLRNSVGVGVKGRLDVPGGFYLSGTLDQVNDPAPQKYLWYNSWFVYRNSLDRAPRGPVYRLNAVAGYTAEVVPGLRLGVDVDTTVFAGKSGVNDADYTELGVSATYATAKVRVSQVVATGMRDSWAAPLASNQEIDVEASYMHPIGPVSVGMSAGYAFYENRVMFSNGFRHVDLLGAYALTPTMDVVVDWQMYGRTRWDGKSTGNNQVVAGLNLRF